MRIALGLPAATPRRRRSEFGLRSRRAGRAGRVLHSGERNSPIARVIVVGAGPAGAALAYLLARNGVEVALLERQRDFAREFRGEVLLPGGLEIFEQMGLWKELEAVPHVTLRRTLVYVGGRQRARVPFDPAAFGKFAPRWLSQPALLEMLVAQGACHESFAFERGASVRELVRDDGRCAGVKVVSAARERELRGALVVGADGRTSVVRKRSGLPEERDPTPMDIVWCKVPLPAYARTEKDLRVYLGGGRLLISAPVYDDMLQIAWIIPKGSFGEIRRRGMAECLEEMARHVSPDLGEHLRRHKEESVHTFLLSTVSDRVREWSAPGLLLIGDAAHTMSPVGAQGLNIALRDAVVAANQLVPVLRDGADADAIDAACRRIQEERVPEVSEIQRLQAVPPRVILRNTWWAELVLRIAPLLFRTDVTRGRGGSVFRRIAYGVTDVRLRV